MEARKGTWFKAVIFTLGSGVFALYSLSVIGLFGGERSGPLYFKGGPSDIDSGDPDRAVKAIRKWSNPEEWSEEGAPEAAPYFWDYGKVGRPVFIRILKNSNTSGRLEVWLEEEKADRFEFHKAYRIVFHSGGPGPKTMEGDLQAPEGFYSISRGRLNPNSAYHLSMDIGYPNEYDRGKERSGSLIMIHGKSLSLGCFAMSDASIEQIYTLVSAALKNGQASVAVHCFPFPMTEEKMEAHCSSEHVEFWMNLKEGSDWFESHQRPPRVSVKDGRYVFGPDR
jgi:hypothetical protein